jgi:hypothetical protein
MKIDKLDRVMIIDGAIIAGLMFYIAIPSWKGAVLCFISVLILELLVYYFAWKIWNTWRKHNPKKQVSEGD